MEPTPERNKDPEIIDLEQFRDEIAPYYVRFAELRDTVTDPKSPLHPDKMKEIGDRYKDIRESVGLKRADIITRFGIDRGRLAAFEFGFIPSSDMPEGFIKSYAGFLRGELIKQIKNPEDSNQPLV